MKRPSALVGYTGFVGANIGNQIEIDEKFNSKNSHEMKGRHFSTVYFSAAPAEKWKANAHPENDAQTISNLIELLQSFSADNLVLISTIDVYDNASGVDENSLPNEERLHSYGLNRLRLEKSVINLFLNPTILRLPALFGPGLKKNAIFDLIHDNEVHKINPNGSFQLYNIDNLAADTERARSLEIPLLNLCSQPIRIGEVAENLFGTNLNSNKTENPASYDVRSLHASLWGGSEYLYSANSVLGDLEKFIGNQIRKSTSN
jgi:nucleoside-diphosphate-sugar epimerase